MSLDLATVDSTNSHLDGARTTAPSVSVKSLGLAAAQDFPKRIVVIFDGQCLFCQKQVIRLNAFDRSKLLAYVSLHDEFVKNNFPELTHDQMMAQMYVVTPQGQKYGGAKAIRFLSRKLFMLWPIAPLLHIPFSLWFWQTGYQAIAKRRYKISQRLAGKDECEEACEIHFRK